MRRDPRAAGEGPATPRRRAEAARWLGPDLGLVLAAIGVLAVVTGPSPLPRAPAREGAGTSPQPPVAVFAELEGTWTGTFVGYGTDGGELYRIEVQQTYRTVDAHTQRVEIRDTLADGTVVTGTGENVARRREDGSLALSCIVTKSNGDRVEHQGSLVRSPGGGLQLLWHSRDGDREEAFRERVVLEGEETVYRIDGVGRYGGTVVLLAGRYVRQ